jgi:hypothetical protein
MAIVQVPIAKAGTEARVEVNTDAFVNDEVYLAIFAEGLKACLNSKMAKVGAVTKKEGKDLAEAQALAMDIASKNLAALLDGTFKFPGQKAKTPEKREVVNEAMRLARDFLRDQIVASGMKVSHIPPKDITAGAKKLIETDPSYLERAKENISRRSEAPATTIDLSALGIHADPEKVRKAEEAKVARKSQLSAAQAGKTKPRATATKVKPPADLTGVLASASVSGRVQPPQTQH